MKVTFFIKLMGKPRMTRADRWRDRPPVLRYREMRSDLQKAALESGFKLPDTYWARIYLPMPDSWSEKKKLAFEGKPHQQKPDKDNLEKSIMDCLKKQDQTIWDSRVTKFWSKVPRVEFTDL